MLPNAARAQRLVSRLAGAMPDPLCETPAARAWLEAARQLAHALMELDQKRLTIGFLGGTGVGKSTLLNAIAAAPIAQPGDRRPTTDRIVCYRHADFPPPSWLAASDLAGGTEPHRIAALHGVILLDLPDIDSFAAKHRAMVGRVLPNLDVLLVVTSVDKYADLSLYRELADVRQAAGNVVFVLNAVDRLRSAGDQERLIEDFRQKLSEHSRWHEPQILAISALRALERTRTGDRHGLEDLLAILHSFVSAGRRRAALVANAESYLQHVERCRDEALPPNLLESWLQRLAKIPAELPPAPAGMRRALAEELAAAIQPWLSDRALRRSSFPLDWAHFVLRRWWPGLRRGRPADPFLGESAPGARFAEELLERPLRLATLEAEALGREMLPRLRFGVPAAAAVAAPEFVEGAGSGDGDGPGWEAELRGRADRLAWRWRHHAIPFVALLSVLGWFIAPLTRLASEDGWWTALLETAWSAAARLSPLAWVSAALATVLYYLLCYPYFLFRMEQRSETEAERGVAHYLHTWSASYRRRFGAAHEQRVDSLRAWWNEVSMSWEGRFIENKLASAQEQRAAHAPAGRGRIEDAARE